MTQILFDPFDIKDDGNNIHEKDNTDDDGQLGTTSSTSRETSKISQKQHDVTTTSKLPARLNVTLLLHEEVSSIANKDSNLESAISSHLDIEGKIVVRAIK